MLLVRHGESHAQVNGIVSGHRTCTGLSDAGRRQVDALGDRLRRSDAFDGVKTVYTSVLRRAVETAEIIATGIDGGVDIRSECALCELHPGDAEGMTWSKMRERFPATGDPDDPFRRRLPGMETWAEMYVRVGTRLSQLADEQVGGTVVVVGHGGTVGASFIALGDMAISQGINLTRQTANASITEWSLQDGRWRLARYNDTAHVEPS